MKAWLGVAGIILVAAAVLLIRIPTETDSGMRYTGLLVSERVMEYPISVSVVSGGERDIGVALQDSELDFGRLVMGMVARKSMSLQGDGSLVSVRLWPEGNISPMVSFSHDSILLKEDQEVEVIVNATKQGSFSGRVMISVSRPSAGWLGGLVQWL